MLENDEMTGARGCAMKMRGFGLEAMSFDAISVILFKSLCCFHLSKLNSKSPLLKPFSSVFSTGLVWTIGKMV